MERTFFSRVVFRLIKDGETIKELWCVLFAYFQHTNTGYFQLLMETTPREHPCRGVRILCSTCGIVQLHSIVAPPSTTTGVVGLSNTSSLGGFQSRGRRRGRGEICVPLPSLCDQSVDILLQTLLFLDQPFRGQRAGDGESSVELRFCCWE